jgi:hypothetical protein
LQLSLHPCIATGTSSKHNKQKWAKCFASLCDIDLAPTPIAALEAPILFHGSCKSLADYFDAEMGLVKALNTSKGNGLPNQEGHDIIEDDNLVLISEASIEDPVYGDAGDAGDNGNRAELDNVAKEEQQKLVDLSASKAILVRPEWIGTSQFQVDFALQLQERVSSHV